MGWRNLQLPTNLTRLAATLLAYRRFYLLVIAVVVVGWPVFSMLYGLQRVSTIGGALPAESRVIDATSGQSFPNIVHQIWMGYTEMPPAWNKTISSTRRMNAQAMYKLWSKQDIESLLEEHYPWFLVTYRSYSKPIQQADAARYFILHHHGGMYIDMDIGSRRSMEYVIQQHNLTNFDCVLPESHPIGMSNDLLMCKRGSPFMSFVTSRLSASNRWYLLPYATVMFSTGPAFLSQALADYQSRKSIFVLSNELYTRKYFYHIAGSTWHQWDAIIVKWLYGLRKTLSKYWVVRYMTWTIIICFIVLCLKSAFRKAKTKSKSCLM